jgi:hypothetical protein
LTEANAPVDAIERVIESARRLGVEVDEHEATQWIAAMQAETQGSDVVVDVDTGVFGFRASMLDLDPGDLAHFRRIAEIVRIPHGPGVQTALALSGSAAQSRIQRYPGDADFFERVHITAPTREAACRTLGKAIREKALATLRGRTHRLAEVKFGTWDAPVTKNGAAVAAGSPVSWTPQEVAAGQMDVVREDGSPRTLTWADAAANPGWCKIDWIVADTERGQLANASNCLDTTWEAPDGSIVALDGFLDPYFQEVYLDVDSKPLFDKLIGELSTDAVADYVAQLEHEVWKYTATHPNWGKVARRLYNIFRLTARYPEAAYIRELFDEPTTALYQLAARLRAVDEAAADGSPFDNETLVEEVDQLIMSAIEALSGRREAEVVAQLLRLRDEVSGRKPGERSAQVRRLQAEALDTVNDYFRQRLLALPEISDFLDEIAAAHSS